MLREGELPVQVPEPAEPWQFTSKWTIILKWTISMQTSIFQEVDDRPVVDNVSQVDDCLMVNDCTVGDEKGSCRHMPRNLPICQTLPSEEGTSLKGFMTFA